MIENLKKTKFESLITFYNLFHLVLVLPQDAVQQPADYDAHAGTHRHREATKP